MPVHAEAQEVPVKAIFNRAVFDDEASMDHAGAGLLRVRGEELQPGVLHEGDGISFRVAKCEMLEAVNIPGNDTGWDVVHEEIAAHRSNVGVVKATSTRRYRGD